MTELRIWGLVKAAAGPTFSGTGVETGLERNQPPTPGLVNARLEAVTSSIVDRPGLLNPLRTRR